MYTTSELRTFMESLDDSNVAISTALTFLRDATAYMEQPLLKYSRAWLEMHIGSGQVASALSDHQLMLVVTASMAAGRRLPMLLRSVTISALDSGYSVDDILYDALSRACTYGFGEIVGILSDFVRGRPMVSKLFIQCCAYRAKSARRLHALGAECCELSLRMAVRYNNVDAVRMHMNCKVHDTCFLALRVLDEARSPVMVNELMEFVSDGSHGCDHFADDYLVVDPQRAPHSCAS